MNPIIQLQQCFMESAMAGTSLLNENFRLKKAVESLTPFAARNPVFQKIQEDAKQLFLLPKPQQGSHLLKTLALINAVTVTMAPTKRGEGEALESQKKVGMYVEIPYSHMESLLYGLTQKGPGREEIIVDMFQNHGEYFWDYRLRKPLLQGLKDPYIAAIVCRVIVWLGTDFLPHLLEGLDYNGKRDMGYRVFCITKITGNLEFKKEAEEIGSKVVKEALRESESFEKYWERIKF